MQNNIHPKAQIGANSQIAHYVTIEEDVVMGDNCVVGPNVVIHSGSRIGSGVKIYSGAVVGGDPQDLKYAGEPTTLEIGDGTVVREFCTLNRGTSASGTTKVGSNCLLMAYVHVAHDCILGDQVILANATNLAGHVEIGDHAILGGMTAVHQFVQIGKHVMISGGSLVRKDVPPFITAAREPLSYVGVNSIGLSRRDFASDRIQMIQDAYKYIYVQSSNVSKGIDNVKANLNGHADVADIVSFIQKSTRGVIKGTVKSSE